MRQAIKLIAFYFCLFSHLLSLYCSLFHSVFSSFKPTEVYKNKYKDKNTRRKQTLFCKVLATFWRFHDSFFMLTFLLFYNEKHKIMMLNIRDFCERFVTFCILFLEKKAKILQQNNTKQTPLKATFLGIIKLNIQVLHF